MKKIYHLASFNGNYGDKISHLGIYNILNNYDVEIEKEEIREYYTNSKLKKSFNQEFVDKINNFDLFILGGGGFFDYWVDESNTGTTFNITIELFRKIKVPIFFSSLGAKPHKNIPPGNKEKFKLFLQEIEKKNNCFYFLRNDGTKENLVNNFNINLNSTFISSFDNAFFNKNFFRKKALNIKQSYVIINIAHDQLLMRETYDNDFSVSDFYLNFSKVIDYLSKNYNILFALHIPTDVTFVQNILNLLSPNILKNKVYIGEYGPSLTITKKIIKSYNNAEFILAGRYHSNITGFLCNTKTIGVPILSRVSALHKSVNSDGCLTHPYKNILEEVKIIRKKNELINYQKLKNSIFNEKKKIVRVLDKILLDD